MILHRYLVREVLYAALGVLAVLLLAYVSHRFVRFLSAAASGAISGELIVQLVLLKLGSALQLLVPLALYGGVLLGLGRLHRDSEIVAMSAGGFGTRSFVAVVLGVGTAGALAVGALSLGLSPHMAAMQEYLLAKAKGEALVTGLVPGRFQTFGGDSVVYVERVDRDASVLGGVFVRALTARAEQILVAERAYPRIDPLTGDRFVVMENGTRYAGTPGGPDYVVTEFAEHALRLDTIDRPAVRARLEAEPSAKLLSATGPAQAAELQWRLAMPISALLLPLLALPLARTSARQGRYARLFLGALVYFAYNNLLGIAQNLTERGELPVSIGLWPVHAVLLGAAVTLIYTGGRGPRLRGPGPGGPPASTAPA